MSEPYRTANLLRCLTRDPGTAETRRQIYGSYGSCMNINFQVTNTTKAFFAAKMGADTGQLTIFMPHGEGKITRDAGANQKMMTHLDGTQGFNSVHASGA